MRVATTASGKVFTSEHSKIASTNIFTSTSLSLIPTMAAIQIPQTSRSPSPALSAPIPTAPGPRATALEKLYADAITHVLKTCNYANFSACFPTPAREVPGSLKLLHEQFTEKLGEGMRREFESILEDRHVLGGLNELDGLIDEARRRRGKGGGEGGRVP